MSRVNKFHGPDKQVLADISLSFLPGAKIGVLGPNGAGKSTLLRIMAGLDEPSNGRAELAPGATVGYLPQEPELDPARDVRGNVELGVAENAIAARPLQRAVGEVRRADVRRRDGGAAGGAGRGAGPDRAAVGLEPRPRCWISAMDALRCPPADADVSTLSGGERRRVALCRLLLSSPDLLLLDEPTNHLDAESVAWLEQFLRALRRDGRWPSPTIATSSTTSPAGSSSSTAAAASRSRATTRRGSSRRRRGWPSRRSRRRPAGARCSTSWSGCGWLRARATPSRRRGWRPTSSCWPRSRPRQARLGRDPHPGRRAAGRQGGRGARPRARASATGC